MISERTGNKLDRTFDQLKPEAKHALYLELKDLGLKIEFGAESWYRYMRRKSNSTQGKMSKLYKLLAEFEKDDIDTFMTAFTDTSLQVPTTNEDK
jgi:hypothetical protein